MNTCKLSDMLPGDDGQVLVVQSAENIKRRFYEIGLIPKTIISCLASAPGGDPKAYRIRGAVIAIRREDSDGVVIHKETV